MKISFRDDGTFFGSGKQHEKGKPPETAALEDRADLRIKKCHSEGSAVVQKVTQRESGSAHGFVFQGTADEDGETPVQVGTYQGENKVGKHVGCLQPAGKQAQAWDSVGWPVVQTAKGTGKAERP